MGVWQEGQRDAGATMDKPAGIRRMQTFKKLPAAKPKRNTNTTTVAVSITLDSATSLRSPQGAPPPACPMPNRKDEVVRL